MQALFDYLLFSAGKSTLIGILLISLGYALECLFYKLFFHFKMSIAPNKIMLCSRNFENQLQKANFMNVVIWDGTNESGRAEIFLSSSLLCRCLSPLPSLHPTPCKLADLFCSQETGWAFKAHDWIIYLALTWKTAFPPPPILSTSPFTAIELWYNKATHVNYSIMLH